MKLVLSNPKQSVVGNGLDFVIRGPGGFAWNLKAFSEKNANNVFRMMNEVFELGIKEGLEIQIKPPTKAPEGVTE